MNKFVCLTACFLATGDLVFIIVSKCMFGPQQGLHLFCLIFYSQIHVKCMQFRYVRSILLFVFKV